jgi:hypothetical protein
MDQKEFARLGGLVVKKKYGKGYFKKLHGETETTVEIQNVTNA